MMEKIEVKVNGTKILTYIVGTFSLTLKDKVRRKQTVFQNIKHVFQTLSHSNLLQLVFSKSVSLQAPLSKKIQEYHESGYIEDLVDVHFADSRCYKQRIKQEDSRLEVTHHAGSFVMLCVGIIVGVGILFLEHGVFKWLVPRFRSMPGQSFWKSVHVMFFSQVS